MHPVHFDGAIEIGKPHDMTDEQCMSIWAQYGVGKLLQLLEIQQSGSVAISVHAAIDAEGFPFYLTAWQPNKEDIQAINDGRPIFIKTIARNLPPMAVFTLDENDNGNF